MKSSALARSNSRLLTLGFFLTALIIVDLVSPRGLYAGLSFDPAVNLPVGTSTDMQLSPEAISDGNGGAIAASSNRRSGPAQEDIHAQLIQGDCSVDDRLEQNDDCSSPLVIPAGGYPGLIVSASDQDWYRISVPRSAQLNVTIDFTHAEGDIDLSLYDGLCSAVVLDNSSGTTNTETVSFMNLGPTSDVFLKVYLFSGTCNDYDMTIDYVGTSNLNATVTPAGWSAPVLPRNQAGATSGSALLTPVLDGNAMTTYMNWSTTSEGINNLPVWVNRNRLDGSPLGMMALEDNSPAGTYTVVNMGPYNVRGGRHTVAIVADPNQEVPETNEADNTWQYQWVWSPLQLTHENPVIRPAPPEPGAMIDPNADGMRFDRDPGYAWVTSIAPRNEGDDYDLVVYDDYASSTAGFSNLIGLSAFPSNLTDFVVGHFTGTPTTLYPAITLWQTLGGGGEFVIDESDARARNGRLDITPLIQWPGESLPANRLANVYEAYLNAGTTYSFSLLLAGGNSSLAFEVLPGFTSGVHGRASGFASDESGTHFPFLNYAATETGWHPIVVYRKSGTDANQAVAYEFLWGTPTVGVPGPEPEHFTLAFDGAWPNPIAGESRIVFVLSRRGPVRLEVYDVRGRRVQTILEETLEAGPHVTPWNGTGLGAGIYWLRFAAEGQEFVKRAVLLK